MKIIKNNDINLSIIKSDIDNLDSDLKKIPFPLPPKSSGWLIVGSPGSGKTSMWTSLIMSKNQAYWMKFDKIYLISGSLSTLPEQLLKNLDPNQIFDEYHIDLIKAILSEEKESGENPNMLLILDDVVKDIRAKNFNKIILNRRHILQNPNNKKIQSGLTLWICSQSYNLLELQCRKNLDHFVLFKSSNLKEIKSIKSELMSDLTDKEQDEILNFCWSEPYSFLFIKNNSPKHLKYFRKFDLIDFKN